jgi:hypothetical protein
MNENKNYDELIVLCQIWGHGRRLPIFSAHLNKFSGFVNKGIRLSTTKFMSMGKFFNYVVMCNVTATQRTLTKPHYVITVEAKVFVLTYRKLLKPMFVFM